MNLANIQKSYRKEQIQNIQRKIGIIGTQIDLIPLKAGHVDHENPKLKRLSNKRAKLYEELRAVKAS